MTVLVSINFKSCSLELAADKLSKADFKTMVAVTLPPQCRNHNDLHRNRFKNQLFGLGQALDYMAFSPFIGGLNLVQVYLIYLQSHLIIQV